MDDCMDGWFDGLFSGSSKHVLNSGPVVPPEEGPPEMEGIIHQSVGHLIQGAETSKGNLNYLEASVEKANRAMEETDETFRQGHNSIENSRFRSILFCFFKRARTHFIALPVS